MSVQSFLFAQHASLLLGKRLSASHALASRRVSLSLTAHSNTQTVVTHRPTKTRTQTHKVPTKATRQPRRDRESVQTKLSPRRGGRTIVQIVHDQASLTRLCSSRPLSSFSLPPAATLLLLSSVLSKKAACRHPPPSKNHLLVVTPFTSAGRRFCCRTTAAGSRPACSSAPNCTLS